MPNTRPIINVAGRTFPPLSAQSTAAPTMTMDDGTVVPLPRGGGQQRVSAISSAAANRNPTNRVAIQQAAAPAPSIADIGGTPEGILDQQLQSLGDVFEQQAQNLGGQGFTTKEHNTRLASVQHEYDDRKAKLTQTRDTMGIIQQLMDAGDISEADGNKALYNQVLPRGLVQDMFQEEQEQDLGAPASKAQLTYFDEISKAAIESAPRTGTGWFDGSSSATEQEALIQEYVTIQGAAGYWGMGDVRQNQFDKQFDKNARATPGAKWNPDAPIIRGLRSKGSNAMFDQAVSMLSGAAKQIMEEKKRQQKEADKTKNRKGAFRGFGGFGSFGAAPPQSRTAPAPEPQATEQGTSRSQLLSQYKALGGSKTQAGRDFADRNLR